MAWILGLLSVNLLIYFFLIVPIAFLSVSITLIIVPLSLSHLLLLLLLPFFRNNIYIYIIIIIMSRHLRGSLWPSLATLLYRPSLLVGLQDYIGTELFYACSSLSSCLRTPMRRVSPEYVTYEVVHTSPAVSRMSGSSSFRDGGKWPYSCCFVGCYLQDLFNTARSILV